MSTSRKPTDYWMNYWSSQTDGQHRSSAESFLKKEAKEKLFHMPEKGTLLDFGCGAGELLVYYAKQYDLSVGVDASSSMLAEAERRLEQAGLQDKVKFLQLDDQEVWAYVRENSLTKTFDCIAAGQVIQYLDKDHVDSFIKNAIDLLADRGRISLFDVVHSKLYPLWKAKFFDESGGWFLLVMRLAQFQLSCLKNYFQRKSIYHEGYLYLPSFFKTLAKKYNLQIEIFSSMYYEYRYHVILCKKR